MVKNTNKPLSLADRIKLKMKLSEQLLAQNDLVNNLSHKLNKLKTNKDGRATLRIETGPTSALVYDLSRSEATAFAIQFLSRELAKEKRILKNIEKDYNSIK